MINISFRKKERMDIFEFNIQEPDEENYGDGYVDISMGQNNWARIIKEINSAKASIEESVFEGKFNPVIFNKIIDKLDIGKFFPHLASRRNGPEEINRMWLERIVFEKNPVKLLIKVDSESSFVPWEYGRLMNKKLFDSHIISKIPSTITPKKLRYLTSNKQILMDEPVGMFPMINDIGDKKFATITNHQLSRIKNNVGKAFFDEPFHDSYEILKRSIRKYRIMHLFCHGPGLEASDNRLHLKEDLKTSIEDFISSLIEIYIKEEKFPELIIFSVCGGANILNPNLITHFFENTPVRNIIISSYSLPINDMTFDFYENFYKNLFINKMSIGESFYNAVNTPFNVIGALHQLWGSIDTYFNFDMDYSYDASQGPLSSVQDNNQSDAILIEKINELQRQTLFDEAGKLIDEINNSEFRERMLERNHKIVADSRELVDRAADAKEGLYTNLFIEGSFIDGIELGQWDDNKVEKDSGDFYDYISKNGSIRVRIPKDQSESNIERLDNLIRSYNFNMNEGLERYYYGKNFKLFNSDLSVYYISGEMPEGVPLNSQSVRDELTECTPEERLNIAARFASDICKSMNLFHEKGYYFQSIGSDDIFIKIKERTVERVYIKDAIFKVLVEDRIEGLPQSDEYIDDKIISRNIFDVSRIAFNHLLEYPENIPSPFESQKLEKNSFTSIMNHFQRTKGFMLIVKSNRFQALLKLTEIKKSRRYKNAKEASIILQGSNTVFFNEIKSYADAGNRMLYLMDRYEENKTIGDIASFFGGSVRLEEIYDQYNVSKIIPGGLRVIIIDANNSNMFFQLVTPDLNASVIPLIDFLNKGIHILILDINDVFKNQPNARYFYYFTACIRRYFNQSDKPGFILFYTDAFFDFLTDKSLLKNMKIIINNPYEFHDYYRELFHYLSDNEIAIDHDTMSEISKNFIGLTLREVKYIMTYLMTNDMLGNEMSDERLEFINSYRTRSIMSTNRSIKQYNAECSVFGGYNGIEQYCNSIKKMLHQGSSINHKSMIITGYPGTGKRTAVSAIIKNLCLPAVRLDISNLISNSPGTYSSNDLDHALALLRHMQPCILVIDRFISNILLSSAGLGSISLILGTLLTWLQDIQFSDILVIAYDSIYDHKYLDSLKHEFTRSGRFSTKFFLDYPSQESIYHIIDSYREYFNKSSDDIENLKSLLKNNVENIAINTSDIKYLFHESILEEIFYNKKFSDIIQEKFEKHITKNVNQIYVRKMRLNALRDEIKSLGYTILN